MKVSPAAVVSTTLTRGESAWNRSPGGGERDGSLRAEGQHEFGFGKAPGERFENLLHLAFSGDAARLDPVEKEVIAQRKRQFRGEFRIERGEVEGDPHLRFFVPCRLHRVTDVGDPHSEAAGYPPGQAAATTRSMKVSSIGPVCAAEEDDRIVPRVVESAPRRARSVSRPLRESRAGRRNPPASGGAGFRRCRSSRRGTPRRRRGRRRSTGWPPCRPRRSGRRAKRAFRRPPAVWAADR